MEVEWHWRDKLHRQFCDLRIVVPNMTWMDKASLLAEAATYITQLRARVEQLEAEARWTTTPRVHDAEGEPLFRGGCAAAAAPASSFDFELE